MSQHDLHIANQLFPATRIDLNNALAALGSTMSGSAPPPAPVAGMLWIDNSASAWRQKLYDGSDWITIAEIDPAANTSLPYAHGGPLDPLALTHDLVPDGAAPRHLGSAARPFAVAHVTGLQVDEINGVPPSGLGLPAGVIAMWSGTIAGIPGGWALCDGTNGTPDLRDRFIVGARVDSAAEARTNLTGSLTRSGGSLSTTTGGGHGHSGSTNAAGGHNHGAFTGGHALTIEEMPAHKHDLAVGGTDDRGSANLMMNQDRDIWSSSLVGYTGENRPHRHTISTQGTHSHSLSIAAAGSHSHTATPPYFALAFIMKL